MRNERELFAHWIWAVPILLIVAALSLRQINLYPPSPDEFITIYDTGWLASVPYSPIEVIESLYTNNPNHAPGYFLLLNLWGKLTSHHLATGRVLSLYCGLLSLSIAYRLARDFVAPVAGHFAVIIVASNAFYNFYVAELRMYPLLVFAAGAALWLYLRIAYQLRDVHKRDYIALGAAVYFLVNVHAYSATFLLTLGIYHLLFVPRNRRWTSVTATVSFALLLFSPWVVVLITRGLERATLVMDSVKASSWDALAVWLSLVTNGQPFLPLISIVGLAFAVKTAHSRPMPYLKLALIFLALLTLLADATPFVILHRMRYQLPAWFFLIIPMVAGLHWLYVYRKWLGSLVFLWTVAGIVFQANVDWKQYIAGRQFSFEYPPWQVIASLAQRSTLQPRIVSYRVSQYILEWPSYINYSQRQQFFDRAGIAIEAVGDPHAFTIHAQQKAIIAPKIWVLYQTGVTSAAESADIKQTMADLEYGLCDIIKVGQDSVILDYSWEHLNCQDLTLPSSGHNELIDYQFYGSAVNVLGQKLHFVDEWSAREDDSLDDYRMSYQLISAEWENVAQLDLPLVHEGVPRRFSIDIGNVPDGLNRLMVIVYDSRTGDRLVWAANQGYVPEMLMSDETIVNTME